MKALCLRFARDESAATAIEYGLIAGLLSMAILMGVISLGTQVTKLYNSFDGKIVPPS